MVKKSLIGLVVIALVGGGYWYYDDYQKKEKARLIKERDEQIARDFQRMKENSIKEAIAKKERKKKEVEEVKARQKRIAEGNPIIEEVVTYYPNTKQKKEQYTLVEDKKEGLETLWDENGQIKTLINYKNGEFHGESKRYLKGKLRSITNYIDGKKDGIEINYSPYQETHTNYKQGKRHGKSITWHLNKQKEMVKVLEKFYEEGLLEGHSYIKILDTYEKHDLYKKNRLLKSESFYLSGEKRSLEIYIPEQDIVESTYWYKNGQISTQGNKKQFEIYKAELSPAGTQYYYLPTGQKFLELPYVNNQQGQWDSFRLGNCFRWDESGVLTTEVEINDHYDWPNSHKVIRGYKGDNVDDCRLTINERRNIFG